jgi:hypothetical protein
MDAAEQLKDDLQTGRLRPDRLVDLIVDLQRQLYAANQRIADLEKQLAGSSSKVDEPYSLRAEEKRQEARDKKKRKVKKRRSRRGRLSTADKIAKAEREVDVLPDGLSKSDCQLSHTRPVWRLENGHAVLVAYHIYRGPNDVPTTATAKSPASWGVANSASKSCWQSPTSFMSSAFPSTKLASSSTSSRISN